jgi:hypothetical protein
MDGLLLLREDVYAAVAYCEETGEKLLDTDSGHFIGCRAGRVTTVWVEYEVAEGNGAVDVYERKGAHEAVDGSEETAGRAFTLHNVYTHRMRVERQHGAASYHGPDGEFGAGIAKGRESRKSFGADGDGCVQKLLCAKSGEPLVLLETKFSYLGHDFTHAAPQCPSCGLAYISEELATGKIAEVEAMLEDK